MFSINGASRRFLTGVHNEAQHSECTQDVAFNAHVSKNTIQWTLSNIDHLFDITFFVITCSIRKFNETEPISSSTQMIECDLFRLCILAFVYMCICVSLCLCACVQCGVRDGSRRLRPFFSTTICMHVVP